MANKLDITIGDYFATKATQSEYACVSLIEDNVLSVNGQHCYGNRDAETSDIAILCADSLNTYQACELLPSELLQQRNELIALVKTSIDEIKHLKQEYKDVGHCEIYLYQANKLIKKITQ